LISSSLDDKKKSLGCTERKEPGVDPNSGRLNGLSVLFLLLLEFNPMAAFDNFGASTCFRTARLQTHTTGLKRVLMQERIAGIVKFFNIDKGFGFITRDDGQDVFVHINAIDPGQKEKGVQYLAAGEPVEFHVEEVNGKTRACEVTGPGGGDLKGDTGLPPRRAALNVAEVDWTNRETVLAAVQHEGYSLQLAAEELKSDREIVLAAVQQDGYALEWAGSELQKDREIVLSAVTGNGFAVRFAGDDLKNDLEIALAAVKQRGCALKHLGDDMKNSREVVLAAIAQSWYAVTFAGESLKNDREIDLAAIQQDGYALKYVGESLQNDREVVLEAVQQYGYGLKDAGENLQSDRDIVLAAVRQYGGSLRWAGEDMKSDREIVLAAVQQDGDALKYAAQDLQEDQEVLGAAGVLPEIPGSQGIVRRRRDHLKERALYDAGETT